MVSELKKEGYSITKVCTVLYLNRSRYYRSLKNENSNQRKSVIKKDEEVLREMIHQVCLSHPSWGTRKVTTWLKKREGRTIGRKRVQRIMREKKLILKPKKKHASRGKPRKQPVPARPNQWLGIDTTKFPIDEVGWVYLVLVVDWFSRKVVGYSLDVHVAPGYG